jgi:hypothetical protein
VRTILTAVLLLATAGSALALESQAAHAAQAGHETVAGRLIADRSPAVVTIKFLLKDEHGEEETETAGALIDADGLVIASNDAFGSLQARLRGGPSATPTDIRVLIGDDTQGVPARFAARDTELGLAWLQIEESKGNYPFIDLTDSAEPAVGDKMIYVSRMGTFFDRAPMAVESTVTAIVRKPRPLIMPSMNSIAERGLPIFDASGKVVGVTTLVLPERDELEGMTRDAMKGFTGVMVLPAKDVVAATARAREFARQNQPQPDAEPGKDDQPAEPK